MNLTGRKLLPLVVILLFSMALTPVALGQAYESESDDGCACTCAEYPDEKAVPACQSQCNPGWEAMQCAVSEMPETGEKDAETLRFEAELRQMSQMMQYPLQENVIASQVYLFQISAPDQRQMLWDEFEKGRQQLAEQQVNEAADAQILKDMPTDDLDAETLRYKAAVEQLDLPPGMAEDLVEMFQANDAAMRETLWQRVKDSPLRK